MNTNDEKNLSERTFELNGSNTASESEAKDLLNWLSGEIKEN